MRQWLQTLRRRPTGPLTKAVLKRIKYFFILPLFYSDGVAAIEYAFVLPILLLFVLGTVEFSLIMFSSALLEGAVTAAARSGSTGYASGESQTALLNSIIDNRVSGLLNVNNLQISVTPVSGGFGSLSSPITCGNPTPTPTPTPSCGINFGSPDEVVVYTVSYPWQLTTPFMQMFIPNNGGIFEISASSVVQNEPSGFLGGTR